MGGKRGRGYVKCPECGQIANGVVDSRGNEKPPGIWRRRKCHICGIKFTTFEITEKNFNKIVSAYVKAKKQLEQQKEVVEA